MQQLQEARGTRTVIQKCPDNLIQITFTNGFDRPISHTPITFVTSKGEVALKTDDAGVVRYRPGDVDGSRVTINYSDNRPPVEWPVRLPSKAGKYTIRLSIWLQETQEAETIIQKRPDNLTQITFTNGFDRPISNTPITFVTSKGEVAFKTDDAGVIRYRPGDVDGRRVTINYSDNRPPVEWSVRLPNEAGKYTIRLSIWSVNEGNH